MQPWWERYPGLREDQIESLKAAGFLVEGEYFAVSEGVVGLMVKADAQDRKLTLRIVFPASYPYFKFRVYCDDLSLEHHQNPFSKELCLLGEDPEKWYPSDASRIGELIKEMLQKVMEVGMSTDKEAVQSEEMDQAEPARHYYSYINCSAVLIDGAWSIPSDISSGVLHLGFDDVADSKAVKGIRPQIAVLKIFDKNGHPLAQASRAIQSLYPKSAEAFWFRLDKPPLSNDPARIMTHLLDANPALKKKEDLQRKTGRPFMIGVLFPEEVARRETGEGWLFVHVEFEKSKKRGNQGRVALVQAQSVGPTDLAARAPMFTGLQTKKVALAGVGCLGAPSALEFMKIGVGKLSILDGDKVDAATSVRWPFGFAVAGMHKVDAIKDFAKIHYPYTEVEGINATLGIWSEVQGAVGEMQHLDNFVDGADVIFDATADLNVNHMLSDLARERSIPYISISTNHGVWGGRIARIWPGRTKGCWFCYRTALEEGIIPYPIEDESPAGRTQPRGCSRPTYTGTSFDAGEVVMAGVRMLVSTLTEGAVGGYPAVPWDAAVVELRDPSGNVISPTWKTYDIEKSPQCSVCGIGDD